MVAEHATSIFFFPKYFGGLREHLPQSKLARLTIYTQSKLVTLFYALTCQQRMRDTCQQHVWSFSADDWTWQAKTVHVFLTHLPSWLSLVCLTWRQETQRKLCPQQQKYTATFLEQSWGKSIKGQLIKVWTIIFKISNGNRTEWSPKTKLDNRVAGVRFA